MKYLNIFVYVTHFYTVESINGTVKSEKTEKTETESEYKVNDSLALVCSFNYDQ